MAYFVFGAIEMEVVTKLLLAIFLSGIIGLERELKERPAGLRTHILVCMGATFLTLVSLLAFGGDSDSVARVISGTITGIGFLGAGTIINAEHKVRGLTTAAGIWVVAGLGIVLGLGYYFVAVISTILIWLVLRLYKLEYYLHRR